MNTQIANNNQNTSVQTQNNTNDHTNIENHDVAGGVFESNSTTIDDHANIAGYAAVAPTEVVGGGFSPGYSLVPNAYDLSVSDFLARPRRVGYWTEADITVGTTVTFQPLDLFLSAIEVLQKTRNLALLRGTICTKFILTAPPFALGHVIVAKHLQMPTAPLNSVTTADSMVTFFRRRWLLSKTHAILDIGATNQVEIEMPLQQLYTTTTVNNLDPLRSIFRLCMSTLTPIINTQTGELAKFNVTAYVSIKDSDMVVPCFAGTNAAYVVSETKKANKGVISGVAATVSGIAKSLSDVPVIGTLAKATDVGASAVGAIASLFGFSRPPLINEPNYPNYPAGAISETPFRTKLLTLDPLQELPLDNGFVGDKGDALSFANIMQRPGLILSAAWPTTMAPRQWIWTIPVSPGWDTLVATVDQPFCYTPLRMGSSLFSMWRGGLRYRVVIPANKFVRGKLRILWDPAANTGADTNPGDVLDRMSNVLPNVVLDVSTTTQVDIHIPWGQQQNYLPVQPSLNWSTTDGIRTPQVNGALYMYVEEPLIAMSEATILGMYVTIEAADDYELAVPTTKKISSLHPTPGSESNILTCIVDSSRRFTGTQYSSQSSSDAWLATDQYPYIVSASASTHAPLLAPSAKFAPELDYQSDVGAMQVGEAHKSFRPLVKRFAPVCQMTSYGGFARGPTTPYYTSTYIPRIPEGSYAATGSSFAGPGFTGATPTATTPFNWLAWNFFGERGSINWMFMPTGSNVGKNFAVSRIAAPRWGVTAPNNGVVGGDTVQPALSQNMGLNVYNTRYGEPVTWTMPMQINQLYTTHRRRVYNDEFNDSSSWWSGIELCAQLTLLDDPTAGIEGFFQAAAGEDYSPVIWNGVTSLYLYRTPSAAVIG